MVHTAGARHRERLWRLELCGLRERPGQQAVPMSPSVTASLHLLGADACMHPAGASHCERHW